MKRLRKSHCWAKKFLINRRVYNVNNISFNGSNDALFWTQSLSDISSTFAKIDNIYKHI